jgi:hypothetical protein
MPEDERDYPVCMAYDDAEDIEIPESFKTSFQPPYERQISSNCVAQSLANIMEVMWYNQFGEHDDFSVGFIYGNRKDGLKSKTKGMTGYGACSVLCEDGDVKRSTFENPGEVPSLIKKVMEFKEKNPDWKDGAYVPKSYIRTKSTEEVKKFILKYNIPVMAIVNARKFGTYIGYHAMALYGWDGDIAIMQNSWGDDSPRKIVELDFDDIEEFWMITPFSVMNFTDLDEAHWAYRHIAKCVEKELLLGYPDGSFRPEKEMTRAEISAIIYRMLKGVKDDE